MNLKASTIPRGLRCLLAPWVLAGALVPAHAMMQPEDSTPDAAPCQDEGRSWNEHKEAGTQTDATRGESKETELELEASVGAPAAADLRLTITNASEEFVHLRLQQRTHALTATVEGLADAYRGPGDLGKDQCSLFLAKGRKATLQLPAGAQVFSVPFVLYVPTVMDCKGAPFRFERRAGSKACLVFTGGEVPPEGIHMEGSTLTILPKEKK